MPKRKKWRRLNPEPSWFFKAYRSVERWTANLFWACVGAVALAVALWMFVAGPVLEAGNDWLKEQNASYETHVALSAEEEAFFEQLKLERDRREGDGLFTYVYGSGPNRRSDCLRYEGHERELRARLNVKATDRGEQVVHVLKGFQDAELKDGCEPRALQATRDAEAQKGRRVAQNK